MGGKQRVVQVDRLLEVADPGEDRGLEVLVARIVRLELEQRLRFPQRLNRLVLAVENDGVVVARRRKAGRQLEATCQKVLGIVVAAQPCGNFREHADGRHIGRELFEVGAQQRLGLGNLVFAERRGGGHQSRVAGRRLDLPCVGRIGAGRIAAVRELVAQRSPGLHHVRLQFHGPS